MKFYTSVGPNPRVVKLFMAEKGIDIPTVEVAGSFASHLAPEISEDARMLCPVEGVEGGDGSGRRHGRISRLSSAPSGASRDAR